MESSEFQGSSLTHGRSPLVCQNALEDRGDLDFVVGIFPRIIRNISPSKRRVTMRKKLDSRIPATRIKKIMQADEDISRIALPVPLLV